MAVVTFSDVKLGVDVGTVGDKVTLTVNSSNGASVNTDVGDNTSEVGELVVVVVVIVSVVELVGM